MSAASQATTVRWTAPWLLACVLACGGEPVGAKLPRPNPTDVAIVAAAAATAATLADPKAAARKPEKDDDAKDMRDPKLTGETVPADVLDRADDPMTDRDAGAEDASAGDRRQAAPDAGARLSPFDFTP